MVLFGTLFKYMGWNVDDPKKDNGENEEVEMDVDPKQDNGQNEDDGAQDQPKEPGMVLFGTLFKYMGEKKDEESKDDKPADSCENKVEGSKDEEPESAEKKDVGSEDSGEKKVMDSINDKIDDEAKHVENNEPKINPAETKDA